MQIALLFIAGIFVLAGVGVWIVRPNLASAANTIKTPWGFEFTMNTPALLVMAMGLIPLALAATISSKSEEPVNATERDQGTLQPGEDHSVPFDLKRAGPVDLLIERIDPDWTGREQQRAEWKQHNLFPQLFVTICSSEEAPCPHGAQKGSGDPLRRSLPAGPATIKIYNFPNNPSVAFSATIKYPE